MLIAQVVTRGVLDFDDQVSFLFIISINFVYRGKNLKIFNGKIFYWPLKT